MKLIKPKVHKEAPHCVKWIPDVFFLNSEWPSIELQTYYVSTVHNNELKKYKNVMIKLT